MDEMSIFNEALERTDPAERSAFLAAVCRNDSALRERIEQLLTAHDRAGEFLSEDRAHDLGFASAADDDASTLGIAATAENTSPTPGARVRYFGDYEILEEIARGGMGVVFRARQRSLDRIVAVKMILVGKLAGDVEVRRFRREAEAAAKLDHPGIVPVIEVGTYEDQPYFSMAFVDGYSLADPRARVPRPPREAAEWLLQVASAIEHAHALGLVHRDLKPGNILFEPRTGTLKVTDFGLARCVHDQRSLTVSGQILGTPGYMAPEQTRGDAEPLGPAVDIHALGAVLYFLLTGRPPYQADNPVDTLLLTTKTEPVAPRALNPNVPLDVDTICLKCLNKEPSRRYRSAAEVAADLRRWLDGRPILARPVSFVERSWRWVRRNPLTAALSALSLVSILLLATVSSVAYFRTARALADSKQRFYSNQLMLASRELDAQHRNQALWLLKETDPDRRGWEWNYLMRRCTPRQTVLREDDAGARVFWPAGELSLLSDSGTLRKSVPADDKSSASLAPSAPFQLHDVSADHRFALGVDPQDAARVRLLDLSTGAITREWTVPAEQRASLALRADASNIVAAWADGLTLHWGAWSAEQDEPLRTHERSTTRFVGFDTSRQWIVGDIADGDQLRRVVWDVDTGAELMRIEPDVRMFQGERRVLQQPDPKRLVLRDAAGESVAEPDQSIEVFGMRESAARQRFVTLSRVKFAVPRGDPQQSVVHVWRRNDEKPGALSMEHSFAFDGGLADAALSGDGRWLAAAVAPLIGTGQVFVWNLDSGELAGTLRPTGEQEFRSVVFFRELRFEPNGQGLALRVSNQRGRNFWVVWPELLRPAARRVELPIADVEGVAVGADGRHIAVRSARDGQVHEVAMDRSQLGDSTAATAQIELTRRLRQRHPIRFAYERQEKPYELVASNGVRAVYELPMLMPLMGAMDQGKLELRGAQDQLLARLTGKVGLVTELAFNHDGTRLVTISADETTRGRTSLFGIGVDWDSDEFQQSAEIKLWSVPDGRLLWTARGHAGDVTDVAFSADGRRLATSSTPRFGALYPAGGQGEVLIWDAETGQSLFQLLGPSNGFSAIAFSQDGDLLAAAAGNQLWMWDGRPIIRPSPASPVPAATKNAVNLSAP